MVMATRITMTFVCDACADENEDKSLFFHYVIEVPRERKSPKRMEMDLCASCAETYEDDWKEIWRPESKGGLTNVTVKVGTPKPAFETALITDGDRPTVCKKCGFVAKSWNGLLVHKKRKGH
jgi:hypothetical protein